MENQPVEFTKKQYEALLAMVEIARVALDDLAGAFPEDAYYRKLAGDREELSRHLLRYAVKFGLDGLVGKNWLGPVPDDDYRREFEGLMDAYDDLAFWDLLASGLAYRDLDRSMSDAERDAEDRSGRPPARLGLLEEGYRREFEEHGLERLEVVEK